MLVLIVLDFTIHFFAQEHLFQHSRPTAPNWPVVQLLKTQYFIPYLFDLHISQLQRFILWVLLYRGQLYSRPSLPSRRK